MEKKKERLNTPDNKRMTYTLDINKLSESARKEIEELCTAPAD